MRARLGQANKSIKYLNLSVCQLTDEAQGALPEEDAAMTKLLQKALNIEPVPPEKATGKDVEAVHKIKTLLMVHHARVLELFRSWDYDMDASITPHELKRALAALSIPIDTKALK